MGLILTLLIFAGIIYGIVTVLKASDKIEVKDTDLNAPKEKVKIKKDKKKTLKNEVSSSIVWILNAGIALILISGIIFATSTWDKINNPAKIGFLAGFAVVVYIASILCEKLKVYKSARTLWVLADLYTPIILWEIYTNKLIDVAFLYTQKGAAIFYLLAAIICLIIYKISLNKYKNDAYIYACLISLNAILACFVKVLIDSNLFATIILIIANFISLYITHDKKYKVKEQIKEYVKIMSYVLFGLLISQLVKMESLGERVLATVGMITVFFNMLYIRKREKNSSVISLLTIAALGIVDILLSYIIVKDLKITMRYEICIFITVVIEYLVYYLYFKFQEKYEDLKAIFVSKVNLIMISAAIMLAANEATYLLPILMLIITFLVLLNEKELIFKVTNMKVYEYIVPLVLVGISNLIYAIIYDKILKQMDLDSSFSKSVIDSVYFAITFILYSLIYFANVIFAKKDKIQSLAFRRIGLSSIVLMQVLFTGYAIDGYKPLYLLVPLLINAIVYVSEFNKCETELKRNILVNLFYLSMLNLLMLIFYIITGEVKYAPIVLSVILMMISLTLKNRALKQNVFFMAILNIIITSTFEISPAYAILGLFGCFMLYQNSNNKTFLYPITMPAVAGFTLLLMNINNNNTIKEIPYVINTLYFISITIVSFISVILMQKDNEHKFMKTGLLNSAITYETLIYIIKSGSNITSDSFLFVVNMLALVPFIVLGVIYEKMTNKKIFGFAGQAIFYLGILISSLEYDVSLGFIILAMSSIICTTIYAVLSKNENLLKGSLIALVVYALFVTKEIISNIPWWAYIFVLGIGLVVFAINKELKKEKNNKK